MQLYMVVNYLGNNLFTDLSIAG